MKRTLSQCGVGILVTLSMLFVLGAPGRAQVAPVKTLGECKTLEHASRQPSGEDESYEIPADDLLPLLLAHASFEKKDHAAALKGFQTFLRKHGAVTQRNVEVIKALNAMATSCLFLEEYTSAIDALNRLDMWVDDFSIPYRKGRCYARLEQHAAAVDEWRRAVAMAPDNPVPRVELAMLLVETPDLSLRNGDEALALLNGFESQIEEFPSIAMALAAAASATGDFDYAIKMQQRAIALSTDSEGKEYSQFLLGCYQEHWMPFPLFYRGLSPIEAEQRRVVLEQGTVLVRVRGRISHHWTKQGFCEHESVERDHAGTVIDARGLFLVSGATIGINPSVDNGIDANRQSTWINGPIIEVFSIGQPDPLRLGEAEIVGYDAPTNVGVIRIKNSSPIDPIPGLREIPFQPGHLVELADKNDPCYSIEINGGRTPQLDPDDALLISALTKERPVSPLSYSVSPVAIDQDTYKVHQVSNAEDAPVYVSNFAEWSEIDLRIGQPIINCGGECVAIASPMMDRQGAEQLVGIPAKVISRVSGKIASYGRVDRVRLPYHLAPVAKRLSVNGETRVAGGMEVTVAGNRSRLYSEIDGQVILSVDGIPTPSTTEWLVAMERASARNREVIRCEVTASLGDIIRTIELPILK